MAFATCKFSMGATFKVAICSILNIEPGSTLIGSAKRKDSIRLKKAEKASSESGRKHRKELKYSRLRKEHKKKGEEGATYAPGGFDY